MLRFILPILLRAALWALGLATPAIASQGSSGAGGPPPKTIAVLYFDNNSVTKREELEPLRKGLADMFITELSKISALKPVERARLEKILQEMKLAQAGLLDANTAQQVGKLLGAQTLLLGGFVHMFGGKMRLDARLVEVETGVTLKSEEMTGKVDQLFEMVQGLSKKIAKDLEVKITQEDERRLGASRAQSFDAMVYYARGLEYQDAKRSDEALAMYRKALELSPQFDLAKKRIEELTAPRTAEPP